jgi:hypothetical protein
LTYSGDLQFGGECPRCAYSGHGLINRVRTDENCEIELIQPPDQIEQQQRVGRIKNFQYRKKNRMTSCQLYFFGKLARLVRRARDQDIGPGQRFTHG